MFAILNVYYSCIFRKENRILYIPQYGSSSSPGNCFLGNICMITFVLDNRRFTIVLLIISNWRSLHWGQQGACKSSDFGHGRVCTGNGFPSANYSPSASHSLTGRWPAPLVAHFPPLCFWWQTGLHMWIISLYTSPTIHRCLLHWLRGLHGF